MESRTKLLGHPVHPMLIVFPLGLLSVGVLFDALHLATDDPVFADVAWWTILAGIVGGLAAAPFGLLDWLGIPGGTRAKRVGAVHGLGNVAVLALFAVSLLLRAGEPAYAPDVLPFAAGILGVGVAVVTAWLGGELVYRLRVGVDDDASLDASNSIARDGVVGSGDRDGTAASG